MGWLLSQSPACPRPGARLRSNARHEEPRRGAWRPPRRGPAPPAPVAHPHRAQAPQQEQPEGPLSKLLAGRALSAEERAAVTQAVVAAFLGDGGPPSESEGEGGGARGAGRRSGGGGRHRAGRQHASAASVAAKDAGPTQIDLVVEHLCSGQFDEAFLAGTPPVKLNWAIKTLGGRGRLDLAEQLFHWMRLKRLANEHSFVKLCEACKACGQPARALQAWRNTRRMQAAFTLGDAAAAALLKVYRAAGDTSGALGLLAELERVSAGPNAEPPGTYAYNVVLRALADAGDLGAALRLLRRMRGDGSSGGSAGGAAGGQQRPVPRDARTYGAVLSAVRAASAWSRTGAVHRALRADGVRLNPVLAAQLLGCYAAAGAAGAAEAVLAQLAAAGARPNRTHWNALVYAHAEARDWPAAKAAYGRMRAAGHRPDAYTIVALLRGLLYAAAAAGPEAGAGQEGAEGRQGGAAAPAAELQPHQQKPGQEGEPSSNGAQPLPQRPLQAAAKQAQPAGAGQPDAGQLGDGQPGEQGQQGGQLWADSELTWVRSEMQRHRVPLGPRVGTALLAYWLGVARGWQPEHLAQGQQQPREQRPGRGAGGGGGSRAAALSPAEQEWQRRRQQLALAQARTVWKRLRRHARAALAQGPGPGPNPGTALEGAPAPEASMSPDMQQQHHQQPEQEQQEPAPGGVSAAEEKQWGRLDIRAFDCWMAVQLAAGDYRGVLTTFGELELSEDVMPSRATYRTAIEAAARAGWAKREQQLRALEESWRVLHGGSDGEG